MQHHFSNTKQSVLWGLGIVSIALTTLCLFVLPYSKMGYADDDFADAYRSENLSLCQGKDYFSGHKTISDDIVLVDHVASTPRSFFSQLYRPVWVMLGSFQSGIGFGSAYGYLWLSWFLHVLLLVLISLLLVQYTSVFNALAFTSLLGFHPSVASWWGRLSRIQYFYNALILLGLVSLFKSYLDRGLKRAYFSSLVLFLIGLLTHEVFFIVPFWLTGATWWYSRSHCLALPFRSCTDYVKRLSPFFIILVGYFLWRIYLFPFSWEGGTSGSVGVASMVASFCKSMTGFVVAKVGSHSWQAYILDTLWLSALPFNSFYLKLGLVGMAFLILLRLFLYSNYRQEVAILLTGYIAFSWPSLLLHHSPTYLYGAYSFFILALALLVLPFLERYKHARTIAAVVLAVIVSSGACYTARHLADRQDVTSTIKRVFTELLHDNRVQDRFICFVGVPDRYVSQTAIEKVIKKYEHPVLKVKGVYHHRVLTFWDESRFISYGPVRKLAPLKVTCNGNEFLLHYPYPNAWFHAGNGDGGYIEFSGGKAWYDYACPGRASEIRIRFSDEIMDKSPLFVSWDTEKSVFKFLEG